MQDRMQVGQKTTSNDLAQALEGNHGTFFVQQGGQAYLAVSAPGHSIVSLRPVGDPLPIAAPMSAQQPFRIEKISDQQVAWEENQQQRR